MLLAINLHEYFINVDCVALASVLAFQAAGINGPELDTPESNCFAGDSNAAFGE